MGLPLVSARALRNQRREVFIKPHRPWQNGKVERLNPTLQTECDCRQIFLSIDAGAGALAPRLEHFNTQRCHSALGGLPPSVGCFESDGSIQPAAAGVKASEEGGKPIPDM